MISQHTGFTRLVLAASKLKKSGIFLNWAEVSCRKVQIIGIFSALGSCVLPALKHPYQAVQQQAPYYQGAKKGASPFCGTS